MYDEIVAGMRRQILLIEAALNRKLTDQDEIHELRAGIFYLNPEEIVHIHDKGADKLSFFLLEPEVQHDIFLKYSKE